MRHAARPRLRAAELAWVLLALFDAGIGVRTIGWCVGDLAPADVTLTPRGAAREPIGHRAHERALGRRRERHLREGHDAGCLLVGVPSRTLERLLRAWGDPLVVEFVLGLAEEAVDELRRSGIGPLRGWSPALARETVGYIVRRRITPHAPSFAPTAPAYGEGATPPSSGVRDPPRFGMAAQMPRSASKRPASSRSFTWVRNRAASAPSTMRWSYERAR